MTVGSAWDPQVGAGVAMKILKTTSRAIGGSSHPVRGGRKEESADGERPLKAMRRRATLRLPARAIPTLKLSL
jgi:hypothetical protein